jgi:hypothetical protein
MPTPDKADLIEQMLSEARLKRQSVMDAPVYPTAVHASNEQRNDWIGCRICRQQNSFSGIGHWAWHNYCRAELNPIALIEFIERNRHADAADRILRYVVAVTGMDLKAARLALDEEASPAPSQEGT